MNYCYGIVKISVRKLIFYCPDLDVSGESDEYNCIPDAERSIRDSAINNFIKKGIPLPPVSPDISAKMDQFLKEKYNGAARLKTFCWCTVPSTPEA